MAIRSNRYQAQDNEDIVVSDRFDSSEERNTAADLIRQKVARIYSEEPDAETEIKEAAKLTDLSKHQKFMQELNNSGKHFATIQTEWHDYYNKLDPEEKYEVWQEFYENQSKVRPELPAGKPEKPHSISERKNQVKKKRPKVSDKRSTKDIQSSIKDKVTAGGKLTAKHHFQSLVFGLSMGLIVVFVFLFGFFNEVIIAPFIQPSRVHADTPIIVGSAVAPTATPEVIIPKINVQIPVNYTETSTNENAIENDLEDGVVHYPTTVKPGETGNAAFFGHSSNNIFNNGKYKFAFVLLHTLVKGDTFYLTYNGKVYIYKVFKTMIVSPNDVGVLNNIPGQTATATLITCDPPGTSINRLIVVGQQISPDPTANTAATNTTPSAASTTSSSAQLPGNGPTLWQKFTSSKIGKVVIILIILAGICLGALGLNRRKTKLA